MLKRIGECQGEVDTFSVLRNRQIATGGPGDRFSGVPTEAATPLPGGSADSFTWSAAATMATISVSARSPGGSAAGATGAVPGLAGVTGPLAVGIV